MNKIIFIFLDGVGVAPDNKNNPLAKAEMRFLRSMVGGPLTFEHSVIKEGLVFKGIDARLGVKGVPQSATGQTALFSGINAPQAIGYHYPAFPNEELREILRKTNIFSSVTDLGLQATFANAYSPMYFKLVDEGKRAHSVTTVSVLASGIPIRQINDLQEGRAVSWDITNEYIKKTYMLDIEIIEPIKAGRNLARLVDDNSLVVFESFLPDVIGHNVKMEEALRFCETLDKFVQGVVENMDNRTTIVISSDHGNMEDIITPGHTLNPSILLSIGLYAGLFGEASAITDIYKIILNVLSLTD
jgi:2,3-bisphosphoglycerate-independent phosphoglycerate mutase